MGTGLRAEMSIELAAAVSGGMDAKEDAAKAFIREVWGLQGAAYVILGIRYFAQVTFKRRVAWDDLFMVLATVSLSRAAYTQSAD